MKYNIKDYNSRDVVKVFNNIDTYLVHVTQVIDVCPKELIYSNVSVILDIPTIGHIYSMVGTAVHKYISDYINGKISDNDSIDYYTKNIKTEVGKFKHCVSNFKKWYNKNVDKYDKFMSEINTSKRISVSNGLVNKDKFTIILTGTSDLIAKDFNGINHVFDFKTSKTTMMIDKYTEQLGGYKYMFDSMNIVDGSIIILGSHNYKQVNVDINTGYNNFVKKLDNMKRLIINIRNGKPINVNITFRCVMCRFRGVCNGSNIPGEDVEDVIISEVSEE